MSFGNILRKLREEKKLSQTELGHHFDLKQQEISALENDSRDPKLNLLLGFCEFFGVSLDYLGGLTPYRNSKDSLDKDSKLIIETVCSMDPKTKNLIENLITIIADYKQ